MGDDETITVGDRKLGIDDSRTVGYRYSRKPRTDDSRTVIDFVSTYCKQYLKKPFAIAFPQCSFALGLREFASSI